MCRYYKDHEHTLEPSRPKLDEAKKAQLKALLAEQSKLHALDSDSHEIGRQTKPYQASTVSDGDSPPPAPEPIMTTS
ncbi:MAG: hypothetical protein ACI8Z5_001036 [Lentimonas sp.]|jgi:hypothetical protein